MCWGLVLRLSLSGLLEGCEFFLGFAHVVAVYAGFVWGLFLGLFVGLLGMGFSISGGWGVRLWVLGTSVR